MTDPLEEALAAATRGLQALDQQYAAARDANGRLTAQVVQLEIQLRAKTADYDTLLEQYLLQGERFDNISGCCFGERGRDQYSHGFVFVPSKLRSAQLGNTDRLHHDLRVESGLTL